MFPWDERTQDRPFLLFEGLPSGGRKVVMGVTACQQCPCAGNAPFASLGRRHGSFLLSLNQRELWPACSVTPGHGSTDVNSGHAGLVPEGREAAAQSQARFGESHFKLGCVASGHSEFLVAGEGGAGAWAATWWSCCRRDPSTGRRAFSSLSRPARTVPAEHTGSVGRQSGPRSHGLSHGSQRNLASPNSRPQVAFYSGV